MRFVAIFRVCSKLFAVNTEHRVTMFVSSEIFSLFFCSCFLYSSHFGFEPVFFSLSAYVHVILHTYFTLLLLSLVRRFLHFCAHHTHAHSFAHIFMFSNPLDYLKSVHLAISHFVHYTIFRVLLAQFEFFFLLIFHIFGTFFRRYFRNKIENSPVRMMWHRCCCRHQADFYHFVEVDFVIQEMRAALSPRMPRDICI